MPSTKMEKTKMLTSIRMKLSTAYAAMVRQALDCVNVSLCNEKHLNKKSIDKKANTIIQLPT